jgi:hypothetical protein
MCVPHLPISLPTRAHTHAHRSLPLFLWLSLWLWLCVCASQIYPTMYRKTVVLSHLYINAIFLPRQAWDKHRENSKKTTVFSRAELAGMPKPPIDCDGCVEGDSAAPLLDSPHMTWKAGAFSQYARCTTAATASTGYYQRCSGQALDTLSTMGYSVRTQNWRYTEWFPFNDTSLLPEMGTTIARELYDHTADVGDDMDFPGAASDLLNVAEDPAHAATVKELAAMVREGWKGQRPQ